MAKKTASAGAARKAIRWLPTESARMKAMSTSALSSCHCLPRGARDPRPWLSTWSRHRKAIHVITAMVKSETVYTFSFTVAWLHTVYAVAEISTDTAAPPCR
jgi:hypothetical protein